MKWERREWLGDGVECVSGRVGFDEHFVTAEVTLVSQDHRPICFDFTAELGVEDDDPEHAGAQLSRLDTLIAVLVDMRRALNLALAEAATQQEGSE